MARIAFLGLGFMEREMASCVLQAGYEVNVWNRNGVQADQQSARCSEWGVHR